MCNREFLYSLKLMTHGQETCASFRASFYIYVLTSDIRAILRQKHNRKSTRKFAQVYCQCVTSLMKIISFCKLANM